MNDDSLINLVQQYPQLYNRSMWEYKDKEKKKLIWNRIAKELGSTGEICMKRWASLRDRFGRCLHQSKAPSGSAATADIKWQHFNQLEFLRRHMQTKKQRSNFIFEEIQNDSPSETVTSLDFHVEPLSPSTQIEYILSPLETANTNSQQPTPSPSQQPTPSPSQQPTPSPSQQPTPSPSQPQNPTPRKNKRKADTDIDTSFSEVSQSLKNYLEQPKTSIKDPQAHSFGQFVEHCLEEMTPLKKMKTIADITNLLLTAQMEE